MPSETRILTSGGAGLASVLGSGTFGEREGGERSVRVLYERLWEQIEAHMRYGHGKGMDQPHTFSELEHATIRAAVVFLMD